MKKIKKILIINLFLCGTILSFAQKSQENSDEKTEIKYKKTSYKDRLIDYSDIYTYKIIENKDTILYKRKINEYWFGIFGGPNLSISTGSLYSKQKPGIPSTELFPNKVIDFNNNLGYGYSLGILGEIMPLNKDLGFGVQLTLLEKMISNMQTDHLNDAFNTSNNFYSTLTYLTISVYTKYMFPDFDGLFVTGGGDIAINLGTDVYQTTDFNNSGAILHKYRLTDIDAKFRIGFRLGVGYDFFMSDFFQFNNRVRLTPFADFRFGTNFITNNGSSWNKLMFNFGVQLKFSPDRVEVDTLYFDSATEAQPVYIASIKQETGIEYPKFSGGYGTPPSVNLAMIEYPSEIEPIDVSIKEPESKIELEERPITHKTELKITPNRKTSYTFANAASSVISEDLKAYLDELVKFMKENPRTVIRITGHSDNSGSRIRNQERALARANAASDYLVGNGVSKSRIYINSKGSFNPIATNDTEAGRRQNNRIEIEILLND